MTHTIFHNQTALRVITIVLSLSFIPAFMFGIASVWGIVFAVVLALFFDARLQGILTATDLITNEKQKCWATIKHYFLLMVEVTIISSIAPVILLYSGWGDLSIITAIDAYIFNYTPFSFVIDALYQDTLLGFRILISISSFVMIGALFSLILSIKKLDKIFNSILFLQPKDSLVYEDVESYALYRAIMALCIFTSGMWPLFLINSLESSVIQGAVLSLYEVSMLLAHVTFLCFGVVSLVFLACIAYKKY